MNFVLKQQQTGTYWWEHFINTKPISVRCLVYTKHLTQVCVSMCSKFKVILATYRNEPRCFTRSENPAEFCPNEQKQCKQAKNYSLIQLKRGPNGKRVTPVIGNSFELLMNTYWFSKVSAAVCSVSSKTACY